MLPSFIKKLFTKPECPGCALRASAIESLHQKFSIARGAQSAYDRRVSALKSAHPDIWQEFFAKGSETKRMEATNE